MVAYDLQHVSNDFFVSVKKCQYFLLVYSQGIISIGTLEGKLFFDLEDLLNALKPLKFV